MVEAAEADGAQKAPPLLSFLQILAIVVAPVVVVALWAGIPLVNDRGQIVALRYVLFWHPLYVFATLEVVRMFFRSIWSPSHPRVLAPLLIPMWGGEVSLQVFVGHFARWGTGMRIFHFISLVAITGFVVIPAVLIYVFLVGKWLKRVPGFLAPIRHTSKHIVLKDRNGAKAWTARDVDEVRIDPKSRVKLAKLMLGLTALGALSLVTYSFCMGFSVFYDQATRSGLLGAVFGVLFSAGVRVLGVVSKRVAEAMDRGSNTGTVLFPGVAFSIELFVELFGKFLFVSLTSWRSFALWQALSFAAELVSWPLKMSTWYLSVKDKIAAVPARIISSSSSSSRVVHYLDEPPQRDGEAALQAHRRLHAFEFFLHFWAQRLGSLALLVLTFTWRSLPNSSQFEISALSAERYREVAVFLLAQAGAELVQSAIILLLFKKLWNAEPMKEGPKWVMVTGSLPFLFWWGVHILSDVTVFKCLHRFEPTDI